MKKKIIKKILIYLLMFCFCFCFRLTNVHGCSMEPTLSNGDFRICNTLATPKVGDIVIIKPFLAVGDKYIIKRVTDIQDNKIFVQGDNRDNSYDSRAFGWLDMDMVFGVIID